MQAAELHGKSHPFCQLLWIKYRPLEAVSRSTYLGTDIDNEGYSTQRLKNRNARCNDGQIRLSVMAEKNQYTKFILCSSLVHSVPIYGAEAWMLRKTNEYRLQ